jgi:hypothetical protein
VKGEKVEKIHSLDFGGPQEREKSFLFFCFEREGEISRQKALSLVQVYEKEIKNIRASTPPLLSRDQQNIKNVD